LKKVCGATATSSVNWKMIQTWGLQKQLATLTSNSMQCSLGVLDLYCVTYFMKPFLFPVYMTYELKL